jgi:hypothetical protein
MWMITRRNRKIANLQITVGVVAPARQRNDRQRVFGHRLVLMVANIARRFQDLFGRVGTSIKEPCMNVVAPMLAARLSREVAFSFHPDAITIPFALSCRFSTLEIQLNGVE